MWYFLVLCCFSLKKKQKQKHWCQDLVEYPSACAPLSGTKLHWDSLSYLQSTCTDPTLTHLITEHPIQQQQLVSFPFGWCKHSPGSKGITIECPTPLWYSWRRRYSQPQFLRLQLAFFTVPTSDYFPWVRLQFLGLVFCLLDLLESPGTRYPVSSVF